VRVRRGSPATWEHGPVRRAVTIGVFDGVHRGHRYVLETVRSRAATEGMESAVLTFDPHPLAVVAPDRVPAMLTGLEHRLELLEALGADLVAVLPFDDAVRGWSSEAFVAEALVGGLDAGLAVVGGDFRFGRDRAGDVDTLREAGAASGVAVEVVQLVGDDRPMSSTRIRELIAAGDVAAAADGLARPHELWGEVVQGDGRGRSIGVPTANLAIPSGMALPALGVYAATAGRSRDEAVPAVANIGSRPTFDGGRVTVEAHLLDFTGDLYGEVLRLRFVERIRDEQRFEGPDELVAQIERDIERARRLL